MVKRLRASLALFVAAALVVLSPGLEAPRLFAQAIVRAAPGVVAPIAGLTAGPAFAAPAVIAPFAGLSAGPAFAAPAVVSPIAGLTAGPAFAAPAPAARAASVPEMATSLAPHLEAIAKPDTSDSGATAAGRGIEDVITGRRSAGSGDISAVDGAAGLGAPSLTLGAAASAPAEAAKPGVPAAAVPVTGKIVGSAVSYGLHRFLLKTVAKLTGGVYSLPVAGDALTSKLIESAADKSVVFSDFDATLADYNQVLPADMVAAVDAIKAAGKTFVVISDRGDEPRKGQLTVFESLASIPAAMRAGMYVAANSGGRVYRYDDKGEPVRVFEAPAPDAAEKAKLTEAVDATKARLKDIGAELHFPSEKSTVPTESWNVYSYAMMLKIGSDDAHVRGAADILTEEMAKRGYTVQVDPRYAKDPANPPYIVFSLVTKQTASSFIAKALKAEPKDVLVIGDSMYTPGVPKSESWLTRLGEKLSGLALPRTGNRTDRNMELGVPGALMFSVGASGDPRASNLFVLAGKGPSVTIQVLKSVASKKKAAPIDWKGKAVAAAPFVAVGALLLSAAAAYAGLFYSFGRIFELLEHSLRQQIPHHLGSLSMTLGVFGTVAWRAFGGRDFLANPGETYPEARKKAVEIAAARGVPADMVLFVRATASTPVRDGAHWHYTFAIPGTSEGRALIYADASRSLGGPLEVRTSIYENVTGNDLAAPLSAAVFQMNTKDLEPEQALDAARRVQPGLGAGVSVALEPVPGDGDLRYRFYGENGAVASVNARTAEARADSAIKSQKGAEGDRWADVKAVAVPLAIIAAAGASYYFMGRALIDFLQQAEQQLRQQTPEYMNMGAMFGGTLAALAGTIRAVKKPKVGDDEIAAAAKGVVTYKGGVWSETEYNVGYYNTIDDLRKRGATEAQIAAFKKLCDETPVIGGRFNPWAGD